MRLRKRVRDLVDDNLFQTSANNLLHSISLIVSTGGLLHPTTRPVIADLYSLKTQLQENPPAVQKRPGALAGIGNRPRENGYSGASKGAIGSPHVIVAGEQYQTAVLITGWL